MSTVAARTETEADRRGRRRAIGVGLGVAAVAVVAGILLTIFVIGPQIGLFLVPPTPQQYGQTILRHLESDGLWASGPAWDDVHRAVEADLAHASSYADAQRRVRPALEAAGGGAIIPAGEATPLPEDPHPPMPTVTRQGGVVTVTLPTLVTGDGIALAQYTDNAFQGLRDKGRGACGVVVDLRGSASTGLWSQLGGLVQVLPEGKALDVEGARGSRETISVRRSTIEFRGSARSTVADVDKLAVPVVVLVDQRTAADSLALARAFAGAEGIRLAGEQPQARNVVYTESLLPDGATLRYATARYLDRLGRGDDALPLQGDAAEGLAWLRNQCS